MTYKGAEIRRIDIMRSYMAQTWHRMWKENSDELKSKTVAWRAEPTIHRIERQAGLTELEDWAIRQNRASLSSELVWVEVA
jgi:ribosomal protein L15E